MTEERAFWLAWSQIEGIGPVLIRRLHQHFGQLSIAWTARLEDLETVAGLGPQTAELVVAGRRRLDPEQVLEQCSQTNAGFWTPIDADYPRLLLEIPDPPPVLYYQGQVEPLENQGLIPTIAIVGTRSPSDYGRSWTHKLSKMLAEAGFTVVSGLAAGIDTVAHQSCLQAAGRTIAVLGTGVDIAYPAANRGLAQQIGQQGLLLSEYPAGTLPDRLHFPRRNRIIAGLSRATLVLEAPQKSGALITARLANDYGRDVYALPGSLNNSRSRGCLELLNQGAHMILGQQELLDMLDAIPRLQPLPASAPTGQLSLFATHSATADSVAAPPPSTLPPALQQILQVVPAEPIAFDRIVEATQMPTADVSSAIAQLELMGFVMQLPGMRYQREG